MKKEEIFEYVKKQYGTMPEYLWAQSPDNAVLRHKNGKWYAVVMSVEKCKLGLEGNEFVDIMDVNCDPVLFVHMVSWQKSKGLNNHTCHFRITFYIHNIDTFISF